MQLVVAVERVRERRVRLVKFVLVDAEDFDDEELAPLPEDVGLGFIEIVLRHGGAHLAEDVGDLVRLEDGERVHLLRRRNSLRKGTTAQRWTTTRQAEGHEDRRAGLRAEGGGGDH